MLSGMTKNRSDFLGTILFHTTGQNVSPQVNKTYIEFTRYSLQPSGGYGNIVLLIK